MKLSVGSNRRVLPALTSTGSVRLLVPSPRTLSRVRGRPGSSVRSGMPISGRNRPPGSKMRSTLPGWLISNRGSGSSWATTPFFSISSGVGGGYVLRRSAAPFMP